MSTHRCKGIRAPQKLPCSADRPTADFVRCTCGFHVHSSCMGQEYQLLHIESEQPSSPRPASKRRVIVGVAALSAVAVFLAVLSIALASYLHSHSDNLEVLPDNTPASKRGAGLLLTYDTQTLHCLMPTHPPFTTCCCTVCFDQVCSSFLA